jgi:SAM-dependent methyltransferase
MLTLLEILRCPACKGALDHVDHLLRCPPCNAVYPIVDGIPDLIPGFINEPIKKMSASWNNLGFDYDAYIAQTVPERLQTIDAPLLKQCADGKMILEIGCGTARLKKSVEECGSQYIGLDPSLQLLQQGAARGKNSLIRGVGEYLPFPDNSFDTIIGGYCSFRYIRLEQLYPECARLLKPGGILAFTLWNCWNLAFQSIIQEVRQKRLPTFKFTTEDCNDVVSPIREIKRLEKSGFTVEKLLSTKSVPFVRKLPGGKRIFNWESHWKGILGALVGHDIIFISHLNNS